MTRTATDNELWLLSFYRSSEISGALLFGRLARTMRPGSVQADMTRHFADEAKHAALWTTCIEALEHKPLRLNVAYQDRYLEAAGLPMNLMEVLSITQVFEQRVLNQYSKHLRIAGRNDVVGQTLQAIMKDERWHVTWVREALAESALTYGDDVVRATLRRHRAADQLVYEQTIGEHSERLEFLTSGASPDLAQKETI
jgi:bacterioferritin (cytochrome b1)